MGFDELYCIVKRIIKNTSIPLTVDIENGYNSDVGVVTENIIRLRELGVKGINIEDSVVCKDRKLEDSDVFLNKLQIIREGLSESKCDIFLNVRTDSYVVGLSNALEETIKRIQKYEKANIDGIFVPTVFKLDEISKLSSSTDIPLNVMCMPNLPDFSLLEKAGVKRISMGNFLFEKIYNEFSELVKGPNSLKNFKKVFE